MPAYQTRWSNNTDGATKPNRRAPVKAPTSESGRYKFGASSVRPRRTSLGFFTRSDGYWAAAAAWSVGVILSTTWGSSWVIIDVRWLGSTPNFAAA